MDNQAIIRLFATYVYEGKWDEDNIPELIKNSVIELVSEFEKEEKLEEVSEYV